MLKVNNEIPEHRQSYFSEFINFEQILHFCSGFSIVDFEKVSKCCLH